MRKSRTEEVRQLESWQLDILEELEGEEDSGSPGEVVGDGPMASHKLVNMLVACSLGRK